MLSQIWGAKPPTWRTRVFLGLVLLSAPWKLAFMLLWIRELGDATLYGPQRPSYPSLSEKGTVVIPNQLIFESNELFNLWLLSLVTWSVKMLSLNNTHKVNIYTGCVHPSVVSSLKLLNEFSLYLILRVYNKMSLANLILVCISLTETLPNSTEQSPS
jgi:hypothetical protein